MKFSIVTISFNQAGFLERTIQSVLLQKGVEVEYIVVDPGSTDGSRDIIEQYRDRIAHVVYERDKGPADGLNNGFSHATGDVFCYLNSDDTLEPDALARAARYIEANPQYDVVCGHAWVTDQDDRRLRRVWSETFRPTFVAYGAAIQIQPSTFIRREAFLKSGGFNIENRSNWDGELLVDLYRTGARIGILNEFLSCYRLHETSITNTDKLDNLIAIWRNRCFEMLMKRQRRGYDFFVGIVLRLCKHAMNLPALVERLLRGPMRKRGG
tara:strand:- start:9490 stop:10293 length:804 start_codon:yes stop_codon:yes gene_type:complete